MINSKPKTWQGKLIQWPSGQVDRVINVNFCWVTLCEIRTLQRDIEHYKRIRAFCKMYSQEKLHDYITNKKQISWEESAPETELDPEDKICLKYIPKKNKNWGLNK